MKLNYISTLLLFQLLSSFTLCHSQKTSLNEPFNSIYIVSGFDLYLAQGNNNEIKIDCLPQDLDKITTTIENETLTIKANESIFWKDGETPKITVTFTSLKKIIASGGSDIHSNAINLDSLTISAHSGSDLYLTVNCLYTNILAKDGSGINLTGSTKYLKAIIESGSDFHARNFNTKICHIRINGGSKSLVNVTNELHINITGDSDIGYIGSPKLFIEKQRGGSDIYRE